MATTTVGSSISARHAQRGAALDIVSRSLAQAAAAGRLVCYRTKPDNFRIYANLPEPCWYVLAPWGDGRDEWSLRSSRVIVVGKVTGTIHYDGSVGDEG